MRAFRRLPCVLAICVLPLGGCEKKSKLVVPDEGAPATDGEGATSAPLEAGLVLRYEAKPRKFKQTASLEMTQRGAGQYSEMKVGLSAAVDVAKDSDRLKVAWTIKDVDAMELKGSIAPAASDDPKSFLQQHGRGAYLCDLLGEADPEASFALAENRGRNTLLDEFQAEVAKKTAAGEPAPVRPGIQLLTYLPPVLQLPSLPEETLPPGKEVRLERQEQAELDTGTVMPIDIEMTYVLVNVDTTGGSRIAELQFRGRAAGEGEGAGGTIMIESSTEGTLLFDVDEKIPVSYEVSRTESFELGEFSGETTTLIRASWEPA